MLKIKELEGNGDFRSDECIEYLKQADVVVTNPPFSLFREYVAQLMEYKKKFIIIGNKGAINYKEIFTYIKNNEMWIGVTPMGYDMKFILPEHFAKKVLATKKEGSGYVIEKGKVLGRAQAAWWTNVEHEKRNRPIDLYKKYNEKEFPKYDNFEGIEVGKVCDIPIDYDGIIGVPTTFIDKYCPEQFEIIGVTNHSQLIGVEYKNNCFAEVNGKRMYSRLLIRRKYVKD